MIRTILFYDLSQLKKKSDSFVFHDDQALKSDRILTKNPNVTIVIFDQNYGYQHSRIQSNVIPFSGYNLLVYHKNYSSTRAPER